MHGPSAFRTAPVRWRRLSRTSRRRSFRRIGAEVGWLSQGPAYGFERGSTFGLGLAPFQPLLEERKCALKATTFSPSVASVMAGLAGRVRPASSPASKKV